MVPTGTGKPGKMRKLFPGREKSGNFTQNNGKMREFYPKYWKSEENLVSFYLYFYFFSDFLKEVYLLNRFLYFLNSLKHWKNTGIWKEKTGKSRKFVSPKMWEPWVLHEYINNFWNFHFFQVFKYLHKMLLALYTFMLVCKNNILICFTLVHQIPRRSPVPGSATLWSIHVPFLICWLIHILFLVIGISFCFVDV